MKKIVKIGQGIKIGQGNQLVLIAGPCVIESREICFKIAQRLVELTVKEKIPFVFKASYDKANRSSINSFRGPGIEKGLEILGEIKQKLHVPVLTDVHSVQEARRAAEVVDIVQIPAFLCRQTDILVAAAETGKVINVKKGQFLAPWDMKNVIQKIEHTGNKNIILTERGTSFGYNNLVADMRSLVVMREMGYPVVFDATHSVQRPGGAGTSSAGDSQWAPVLARSAVAAGCDGVYLETHINTDDALCDKENMIPLANIGFLWKVLRIIHDIVE